MTREKQTTRKRPGRPRKYAGGRPNATVRFTPKRYAQLKEAAETEGRSISEEVEARIERSFTDDMLEKVGRGLDKVNRDLADMTLEMLQRQTSRIQELEARIDDLQRERALSEEAIERAIDRALARAFAKLGGEK